MFRFSQNFTTSFTGSVGMMLFGLILLLFPMGIAKIFVWLLAAGAIIWGGMHLWQYAQIKKLGGSGVFDLIVGGILLTFGLFCLLRPYSIMSMLPLALGILLLLDGLGKLPAVQAAHQTSAFLPVLLSALIPLVLGLIMILNPFGVTKFVIMYFGISLLVDGVLNLWSGHSQRS